MTKLIAEKPWILIIMGFLLLISVWVFFFVVAHHNQPERLPLSQALPNPAPQLHAALPPSPVLSSLPHTFHFPLYPFDFPSWT